MRVREAMTANPVTIDPEAPLETAAATMRERGLRHLPVVDDLGRLVGIVTDRDLRSAALPPPGVDHLPTGLRRRLGEVTDRLNDVRVRHAMTWNAVTTGPDVPVEQAAAVMAEARIGSLPVVERAKLIGILTEQDLLRVLAASLPSLRGDPDDYFW